MANQTIRDFYQIAQQKDFARMFQFRVTQLGANDFINEDDLIYMDTATLPGRSITNVPVPYMGLSFNVPGTANYPGSAAYRVTFRCDASYNLRSKLEQLTFESFNDDTSSGNYGIPFQNSILQLDLYGSGRAGGIVADQPVLIRRYHLVGMYVVSVDDTAYDVKDTGSVAMINATIAYQYWRASNKGGIIDAGVKVNVPDSSRGV